MLSKTSALKNGGTQTPRKYDDLLRQIADSETFRAAPTMRALLVYLWEHQSEAISEYAIATEALGRSPNFDPKLDSTVRVQVARLRAKLKEFYETAGDSFPLHLSLPLGHHELRWVYQPQQKSLGATLNALAKRYAWGLLISQFVLAVLCVVLFGYIGTLKSELPVTATPIPRLWQSFLTNGKSTTIVVPSPLYFFWPSHQIYVRDLHISDFEKWPESNFVNEVAGKLGPPELSQQYVGAMEMTAGIRLLQYLEKQGQQVHLTESRRFPAESFTAQNTIFLGMPRTAGYLNQMLAKTNFYIASVNPDVIKSRHPGPGEPSEFHEVTLSSDRRLAPAIIILLPRRPEHTRMLLLLGRNLTSIASMLTTLQGLKILDDRWARSGSPEAWEMVMEAEVYRDTVLKLTTLACRPVPASFWK